jgi:hypothetical protein
MRHGKKKRTTKGAGKVGKLQKEFIIC